MTKLKSKSPATAVSSRIATSTKPARRRIVRKPAAAASIAVGPAIKVSKRGQLAALLLRDEGTTLDQIIAETGWLPHTTRAALTGLKKLGYGIDSDKIDGVRTYRAVAPK